MFLSVLSKKEKSVFARLLLKLAEIDGVVSPQEEDLISVYLSEMDLSQDDIGFSESTIDELIEVFSRSSEVVKKSTFIELLALAHADNDYSKSEQELLNSIQSSFSLTDDYVNQVIAWINEITPIYIKGFKLAGII